MRVKDVNLEIHKGEILGLAGVTGNGQTELLEALSGIRKIESGEIQLFNETISDQNNFLNPKELKEKGLVHVPEDRQRMGLITDFKAYENLIFGYHYQQPFSKSSILKENEILSHSRKVMKDYDVRPQSPNLITSNFSTNAFFSPVAATVTTAHIATTVIVSATVRRLLRFSN